MKSSSSCFSSLNSNSFSSKTQTFGCISWILRGFLCSRASPTYPSDQISETDSKLLDFNSEQLGYRGDEPGVVARLMGLDSVAGADNTRIVPESITRSRSMSSVDHVKRGVDQIHGKHRRVRSTIGLHRLPDFVELEDEHFFILSFEKEKCAETRESEKSFGESRRCKRRRKRREIQMKQSKTEKLVMQIDMEGKENHEKASNAAFGCNTLETGILKKRKEEKCKSRRKRTENEARQSRTEKLEDKENRGIALSAAFGCGDPVKRSRDEKMVLTEAKTMKAKCPEEEKECGSCEDSSPVSVLDYDRLVSVRETPESENTSRRRLSPELEANERNYETIQEGWRTRKNGRNQDYHEAWLGIRRISETDIDATNWVSGEALKQEDVEGISEDVVSNVLDQLLEETIEHLATHQRFTCES